MTRKQTGVVLGVVASAIPALIGLIAVATLLLASDGGDPTQADTATAANVRSEVTEALAQESEVRVIISLRTEQPPTALALDLPTLKQEVAAKQASVISALSPSDFTIIHQYDAVPAIAGRINAAALEVLAKHPDVALIEIDGVGHGTLTESVPLINADDVHTDPGSPATGDGVVVAVLDTGLDTDHPDLSDDLLSEDCYLSGGPPWCPNGLATCSGPGCAEDDHGHGSNVTGIITSMGTNGIASTGVAPDADIRAYKVLDANNNGQFSDWLAALNDIISNQPDVALVNMSLGDSSAYKPGNCDGMSIATAINMLRGRGTTTVIASGNDGYKNGMNYPACVANAVSVGMTYDQNFVGGYHWPAIPCTDNPANVDMVTCASNSDSSLDLLAPGADITSTGLAAGTVLFAGTSQATPHVTGVMALVLELNPAYTPDELEYCLESSALVTPTDAGNGVTTPRVDAYESVYNCSTSPPAADQEAIFSVLNPDITVNAPNPCEAAALLTLPGITGTSCSRAAPTPDRVLTPASLGLDTTGQMTDELDAISLSEPFVGPLAPAFHFSVDSSAVGLAGCTAPDVASEKAAGAGEADGDIFTDLAPPASPIVGCNALFQDEATQGLNGGAGAAGGLPEDDMDALTEPYPAGAPTPCDLDGDTAVDSSCPPLSIGTGSAIAGTNDPNGNTIGLADLLVPPGTPAYTELPAGCAAGGKPCVAIPAANLGLAAGDDLDALCWFDNSGSITQTPDGLPNDPPWIAGIYDSDDYFFSLAPGSPTLTALGAGPGAILAPPPFGSPAGSLPVVIAPAATIGLAATDNLDALKCINGGGGSQFVPPPEEPHYKCYDIVSPEPPPTDTVTLETQFGIEEGVSLIHASSLCAPAIKYYEDPDGVGDLDDTHLKCYDIASTDDPDVTVDLTTQFGLEEGIDVGPAQQLCMPVLKEVTYPEPKDPPPGPPPTVPHYKCYEITGDPLGVFVDLETQFGTEVGVEILEPALLCAPAKKTIEPDGEPEGDLDAPHLKCYNILGDDLVPPWYVNLETQFGFENYVQVTFPKQLCVPVVKEIVEEADVKKESLSAEPEPDYGGWLDPLASPPTAAVDEQAFLSVEQQLHNNGPYGPVTVLDIKKIDCPDPGDLPDFVFPGYDPAPHATQCSWVFDPGVIEVEVVGGVQYYFKDDYTDPTGGGPDGKCDPPKEPWFVGPGADGEHTQITIADLESTYPPPLGGGTIDSGDCIVADSTPGVLKEVGIKKTFDLDVSVPLTDYSEADIHCTGPSSHAFTIQDEITILDENVEDPDISNNEDQYIVYVDCLANADVEVTSWSVPDDLAWRPGNQVLIGPLSPLGSVVITADEVLHNNGPWGPVSVEVAKTATSLDPAVCDVDPAQDSFQASLDVSVDLPDSEDFTVNWLDDPKPPFTCDIQLDKTVTIKDVHVEDPDGASATVAVEVVRDTDDDGIPDDGDFSGDPNDNPCDTGQGPEDACDDNCQDDYNPDQTDTDDDGLGDVCDAPPEADYKCYMIEGPALDWPVTVETQFGIETVVVQSPVYLCPPALKNGTGDLTQPHLKWYLIDSAEDPPDVVNLTIPQWGIVHEGIEVGHAETLAVPALKNEPGQVPEEPHYKCYVATAPAPGIIVDLETQFGLELGVEVGSLQHLCAPAIKDGQGSFDYNHLACYAITTDIPGVVVTLETQFGFEEVMPGMPIPMGELCVPAIKEIQPPPPEADKQVTDIVFDYANAYPMCQGTELPEHPTKAPLQVFEVEASSNVAMSVKSIEYNAGPEEPTDSLVSFYADIPAGCEGQWVTDSTFWPHDTRTVGGDPYADPFSSEQWGTDDTDPAKELGDGIVGTFESDLHLQTADYGIEEPVGEDVEVLRFFELHCFEPGQYHFIFCNKIEPKSPYVDPNFPPGDWPGNNLHCEEMVVEAIAPGDQVDKQVTDIDFDWGDQYPCAGQSLPSNPNFGGDQTFSVNVNHPVYLSVTSMEYNDGPDQPDDVEISFFANIPLGCEGRWVVDPNVNPLDIRTTLGDPNVGSSGTTVPYNDPMEVGDGQILTFESDLHFYTSAYKMTEPVGQTLPITRFFEVQCLAEGMYQFAFCNRADVQPPETDPVPGNELVCETMWVLTPNAPGCPNSDASVYDTWNDCEEVHIGTDYLDDCPDIVGDDALPPDQNADKWVDILDVLMYKYKLQPPYAYDPRFDLNIDKTVDILDVLMYKWELPKAWPCP